jgi:hypothetical protein
MIRVCLKERFISKKKVCSGMAFDFVEDDFIFGVNPDSRLK